MPAPHNCPHGQYRRLCTSSSSNRRGSANSTAPRCDLGPSHGRTLTQARTPQVTSVYEQPGHQPALQPVFKPGLPLGCPPRLSPGLPREWPGPLHGAAPPEFNNTSVAACFEHAAGLCSVACLDGRVHSRPHESAQGNGVVSRSVQTGSQPAPQHARLNFPQMTTAPLEAQMRGGPRAPQSQLPAVSHAEAPQPGWSPPPAPAGASAIGDSVMRPGLHPSGKRVP